MKFYSKTEAAKILKLTLEATQKRIRLGQLKATKVGHTYIISEAAIKKSKSVAKPAGRPPKKK